jgi:phosphatidylglycerol:prolipoprotein diacylglycerol transferase
MHPILFVIAGKPIYTYGLMAALGFVAAILTWTWLCRRLGHPAEIASDLACWLMLSGLLGARIAYVVANLPFYLANPAEIVRIDHGGLIFYGGFLLASLALVLFARRRRWPLWDAADFAIPGLAIGHAFGRIGCFLKGCCHGAPATAFPSLGVCYPPSSETGQLFPGVPLYPVQPAEAAGLLVIWFLLLRALLRPHRPGTVFARYLLLYPPLRFVLEWFRGDPRLAAGPLDTAQLLSVAFFVAGLLLLAFLPPRAPAEKP